MLICVISFIASDTFYTITSTRELYNHVDYRQVPLGLLLGLCYSFSASRRLGKSCTGARSRRQSGTDFTTNTPSVQISADGKSPSIWDTFSADSTHSEDGGNTSTATETYKNWEQDIALMRSYGVNSYRLSLSWTRILPDGVAGSKVNKAGIQWYRKVLKGLLEAGIVSP